MAASGTVGILRALLTADAATFQATMKQSSVVAGQFGKSVADLGTTANKVTPQLTRMEKAFSGDKLLYTANNLTRAITNIGGASKLTAAEQEKVNRQLTTAIEKYRALGQQAPAAMLALQQATSGATTATGGLSTKLVAIGSAIGSFVGNLAAGGLSSVVHLGTAALESAGQIADMSKRLGISASAVQGFQYAAEQSGSTIEAFGTAINKLNINLAEGNKSTIGALDDLHLQLSDLRAMKPEDAFLAVADALAKIPDPMERARLGAELMGKGFADISPAIQNDLRAIAASAAKMSDETVAALDEAGDALDRLKRDATIVAGSVVGFFYQMGAAALDYAAKATAAKTKSEEFEEVAARIRKQQGVPGLPKSPGLPTLAPAGGEVRGPTPEEIARVTAQGKAIDAATKATIAWNEAREKEREAIAKASQGMSFWIAGMNTIPGVVENINEGLTSDFLPAVQMSTDAVMAFATQGQDALTTWSKTIVSQNLTATQAIKRYWADLGPFVKDVWADVGRAGAEVFGDMLVGLRGFKEGFLDIWRSIRQALANIFAQMLSDFVGGFLKKMLAAMTGRALAGAAIGTAAGAAAGVAAGGLIPNAGGALTAGLTAGVGGTAAGGGLGATIAGLATNPFTIAGAGALALGLGIWKKGWFRGGEEGTQVNPARDAYLRKYGGFQQLAALLTSVTGEPGGGRLFQALKDAHTMKAFTAATANIDLLLTRRGVSIPAIPGQPFPASPLSALTAANTVTAGATIPAASVTSAAYRAGAGSVNMNVTIQAWDRADLNEAFRTEIIPRIKDAIQINQSGLRTAIAGV